MKPVRLKKIYFLTSLLISSCLSVNAFSSDVRGEEENEIQQMLKGQARLDFKVESLKLFGLASGRSVPVVMSYGMSLLDWAIKRRRLSLYQDIYPRDMLESVRVDQVLRGMSFGLESICAMSYAESEDPKFLFSIASLIVFRHLCIPNRRSVFD